MANLFITGDFHLGHFNCIRYDNRPFSSLNHMNNEIIRRCNERVKDYDTIIHNGDFCFRNSPNGKLGEGVPIKSEEYIKQLKGRWIFVRGNHDRSNSVDTKIERLVLKIGGIYINICHKPDDAIIEDSHYYPLNLTAHVHTTWKTKEIIKNGKFSLMINVGATTNNFYPYSFDELKAIWDKWIHNHPQRKSINKLIITKG